MRGSRYLAPFLKQAKQSAWDYLRRFAGAIPGVSIHEIRAHDQISERCAHHALWRRQCRSLFAVRFFDGIIVDEVADLRPDVWGSIIRPALSDRKGWAFFIGTPKGPDFFFTLYEWATCGFPVAGGGREKDPDWTAKKFRVDETNLIDPKELASAQATMSASQYRQEFLCDFSASSDDILIPIDLVSEACQRQAIEQLVIGSPKDFGCRCRSLR